MLKAVIKRNITTNIIKNEKGLCEQLCPQKYHPKVCVTIDKVNKFLEGFKTNNVASIAREIISSWLASQAARLSCAPLSSVLAAPVPVLDLKLPMWHILTNVNSMWGSRAKPTNMSKLCPWYPNDCIHMSYPMRNTSMNAHLRLFQMLTHKQFGHAH